MMCPQGPLPHFDHKICLCGKCAKSFQNKTLSTDNKCTFAVANSSMRQGSTRDINSENKERSIVCFSPCFGAGGGGRRVLLRKPHRAADAAPAPTNNSLSCLLNGAAQGFDPLLRNQRKRRGKNSTSLSWCRWRGSNPHGVTTNGF